MPPPVPPPAVRAPRLPCVLVLRALGLGDLLAGVPALRAVHRAFPGHELVLAAPAALRDATHASHCVDALFVTRAPGRAVPSLTHWCGPPPDLAIDLHGNGPESHRALAALAPRRLWSFARPGLPPSRAPRWRADEHERARWCRFLGAYGIAADPGELRLPPPDEEPPVTGAVVVHPGADAPARRWPAERYAQVARRLGAAGHRVVLTGGPAERDLVRAVAEGAAPGPQDVFLGLPFGAFSSLVAHATLFVSGDTGPSHLASAHGTPSVTLFGPVPPSRWGPPPGPHTALWHPGPPGDPHAARPDPLLLRIGVDDVVEAALRLVTPPVCRLGEVPAVPGIPEVPGGHHVR
jgi:ADP-heptose:LPS heptosyltransferase